HAELYHSGLDDVRQLATGRAHHEPRWLGRRPQSLRRCYAATDATPCRHHGRIQWANQHCTRRTESDARCSAVGKYAGNVSLDAPDVSGPEFGHLQDGWHGDLDHAIDRSAELRRVLLAELGGLEHRRTGGSYRRWQPD